MSFVETLRRILLLLKGETPTTINFDVGSTTPAPNDSKEILALKWEKKLRNP